MQRFLAVLLFVLFVTPVSLLAQPDKLIINVENRETFSLDGTWNSIADPLLNGYLDYRYKPYEGYYKNAKPEKVSDLIEYNFDTAEQLRVPGDWNSQDDRFFFYEGAMWYQRYFKYSPEDGKRYFIYFGAANYDAKVFVNGEPVGEHVGGFTPFNFEVTDVLKDGENFVVVLVNNERAPDAVPTMNFDWWNYGGITRKVRIIEVPETFVQDYHIQLAKGSMETISGWVRLNGEAYPETVTVSIPGADVEVSAKVNEQGMAAFTVDAELELWSPENPKRYDVYVEAGAERVYDRIGFRSITTDGYDIVLNGKPIFLRGICMHDETPEGSARANNEAHAIASLSWAKELGANFLRLAHYPHPEAMVRMADSLGIMLWEEDPVYWTIQFENPETFQNAANQLEEVINRDRNRAAVIIWSMANETPLSEERLDFLVRLTDHARNLDDTRLISAALERHYKDDFTQMIDDPFGEYLDVIGVNEYIGWYDGLPEKCDNMNWEMIYEKPLIMSEFGGGALLGLRAEDNVRWSEDYQADLYEHTLAMLKKIPFLRGTTPWLLKDFLSPRRPLGEIQDYFNRKGLLSETGEKKLAFYVMQKWYKEIAEEWADK